MVIIKQIEQTKEENEVKEQKKPVEQMPEKTTKKIQIKFNVVERDDLELKSMNFKNIVLNYQQ